MFKKLQELKLKKLQEEKVVGLTIQFQNIISRIKSHLTEYSDIEKIELLSFVLTVIMNDIRSQNLSELLYDQSEGHTILQSYPFPTFSKDEKHQRISFFSEDDKEWVDLSSNIIISRPWKLSKYFRAANNLLHHDFEYKPLNHRGVYYDYLKFGFVDNGIHHTSVASTLGAGKLMLPKCDVTEMFKHLRTDGAYWYSVHSNSIIEPVWDARNAVIYELGKMRYELEMAKRENH